MSQVARGRSPVRRWNYGRLRWHWVCAHLICWRVMRSTISATNCIVGDTMKLMKPTCESGTAVTLRSHSGDTLSPSSFSRSPCRKNSSTSRSVHLLCTSQRFDGWLMSAACNMNDSARDLSMLHTGTTPFYSTSSFGTRTSPMGSLTIGDEFRPRNARYGYHTSLEW